MCQDEVEVPPPEESNPYEEVYKDSSTFLKVEENFLVQSYVTK